MRLSWISPVDVWSFTSLTPKSGSVRMIGGLLPLITNAVTERCFWNTFSRLMTGVTLTSFAAATAEPTWTPSSAFGTPAYDRHLDGLWGILPWGPEAL